MAISFKAILTAEEYEQYQQDTKDLRAAGWSLDRITEFARMSSKILLSTVSEQLMEEFTTILAEKKMHLS